MKYLIEPEVPGGLGPETIMDSKVHPPIIKKLHVVFDGWLGDSLLEIFPVFLVTEDLYKKLVDNRITGFIKKPFKQSKSKNWFSKTSYENLPNFIWLDINGDSDRDDLSLNGNYRLQVSSRAYNILKEFELKNCSIERKG